MIANHNKTYLPLAATALLLGIWSIPGTIALRTLLLLGLFIFVIVKRVSIARELVADSPVMYLCAGFCAFSGFALLHSVLISQEQAWSLQEWAGQHPRSLIALTIGIGLGSLYSTSTLHLLKAVFLCSLIAHLGDYLLHWIVTGNTFLESGITGRLFGQKLLISYIANLYGAVICAQLVGVVLSKTLRWSVFAIFLLEFGFLIFMTTLIGARNGFIGLAMLVISSTLIVICFKDFKRRSHLIWIVAFLTVLISGLAAISWHSDARWQRFIESASAALDSERSMAWLNDQKYPLPILTDGLPADHSAYMRVAGIRGAVQAAIEFPLGYGFGRNSFSHAWNRLLGEGRGTSLSGLGDVLVSLGFFGLFLWVTLSFSVFFASLRSFFQGRRVEALVAAFIVGGFLGRSVIDSNIRDHSLEMFLFMAGALTASAASQARPQA